MGDLDVADFNKARSFLLGWSVLIFCLWFFGADLSAFKLLGNEIKLTRNIENVWLLLALVGVYLWLRYYQRLPKKSLNFNEDMNEVYDGVLRVWVKVRLVFFDRWKLKSDQFKFNSSKLKIHRVQIKMMRVEVQKGRDSVEAYDLSTSERVSMEVEYYTTLFVGTNTIEGWSHKRNISPPIILALAFKVVALIKGVFTASWFSDYLLPMFVGAGAVVLAIRQWLLITL